MACYPVTPTSVVHEPARAESSPRLEPSLQETAKKPPRGSSLESSRLVDPCLSRLESARLVHNTNPHSVMLKHGPMDKLPETVTYISSGEVKGNNIEDKGNK